MLRPRAPLRSVKSSRSTQPLVSRVTSSVPGKAFGAAQLQAPIQKSNSRSAGAAQAAVNPRHVAAYGPPAETEAMTAVAASP